MNTNKHELLYKDEVYKIVGAAMTVSNTLGCGFLEAVYQEAMEIELKEIEIPFESQKRLKINYREHVLKKDYIADFLCYDKIIVEIKSLTKISSLEESQLLNYLKIANLPIGVIINFGNPKLEWKRYTTA